MKKKVKNSSKSGQSGIITVVILILLILVGMVVVWNVVIPTVQKSSKDISASPFTDTVSIDSVKLYPNGDVDVKVSRSSGTQNIDSMQFFFYDSTGGNYKTVVNNPPKAGETLTYNIKASDIRANDKISSVSAVPIISNKPGIEAKDSAVVKKDSGGNYIPEVPANPGSIGLVSWWKFDGDAKDSVGGNDGTIYGPIIFNPNGKLGGAYDFNIGHIDCGNDSSLSIKDNITISLWIYPKAFTTDYATHLVNKWTNTFDANYVFYFFGNYLGNNHQGIVEWISNVGGTWQGLSYPYTTSLNQWYHTVWTYSNFTGGQMYVNGVAVGTPFGKGAGLLSQTTAHMWINDGNFTGTMDEVMIFNKSLNSDEVKALYNNQK